MLTCNDTIVCWYVFGLVICDGFGVWLSDWFSGTVMQVQV